MKITFLVSGSIRSNFSYRPLALAKSLRSLGHDVSIIAPSADKYNDFIGEDIRDIAGVKISQPFQFATRRVEINLLPYLFGATRALLQSKPDLVYIYKPTPISIVGLISKLFHRTETIADFDDLGSEVMRIEGHPFYQRKLVAWSEKLAARHADRLVTASTYLHDMYHEQFPNKPIRIIPNGVESHWFDPALPSQNPRRLVFMGSINRKSILEPLFDALPNIIEKFPDTEALIIGDGRYLTYFKEKSIALHISKNIIFTDWLPLEEAKKYLHAGDIGYNWMPDEITTRAASNMKVPQYMSRGVVPLVSDVGDLSATVDFGNAGYVCTDNLTATLLAALQDPSRWQKSEQAKIFAKKELDWNTLAKGFAAWIQPKKIKSGVQRKIYVIVTSIPGNFGGAEIRNYNLIKQLTQHTDATVKVFSISPHQRKFSILTDFQAVCMERVPPSMYDLKSSRLGDRFRTACEESLPDIVHIEQLQAYYCIRPHIAWLKKNGVKIVFDCHNIEFQAFADSLDIFSWPHRLIGTFLTPHLKELEIEASRVSDIILACSTHDVEFFKTYNPQTFLIPNGVDCSEFQNATISQNHTLIFMGGTGYPPNADAIKFYLREIHPQVKKEMPDVRFLAIGANKKWLDDMGIQDPSIQPLGFVEDVRPYLTQATIGICPIRYGSGTRIKIMTYMTAGLPVISTTKGAEGVDYAKGRDIVIADNANDFAQAILTLLKNHPHRNTIAQNGRDFVRQKYDWNIIGKNLTAIYPHD